MRAPGRSEEGKGAKGGLNNAAHELPNDGGVGDDGKTVSIPGRAGGAAPCARGGPAAWRGR